MVAPEKAELSIDETAQYVLYEMFLRRKAPRFVFALARHSLPFETKLDYSAPLGVVGKLIQLPAFAQELMHLKLN